MSDNRKDFEEQREARRLRKQQPVGQTSPASSSRPAARAGQPPKARQPAPHSAQKASSTARMEAEARGKSARQEAAKRPTPSKVLDDVEQVPSPSAQPAGQQPRLLSRVIIWGTVAIGVMLILATLGEAWTVYRLNQQITANQQAAAQVQAQNQQLSRSVQQLQQSSAVEQEARRLGFIFPGDQPVVVVTTTPTAAPAAHATPPAPNWWGFWPDWLKLFFGG